MKNIFSEKIASIFLMILVVGLYFYSIIFSYFVIKMNIVSMSFIVIGGISLLLYVINCIRDKSFKIWNLLVLFIVFGLYLSYDSAFDKYVALNGYASGREGIFVIISYYCVFLYCTTIKSKEVKNKFITILTICGIFNLIYGFMQVLNLQYIFDIPVARNWNVASGFVYNPDFMGTYMIILLAIWLPKYLFEKDNKLLSLVMTLLFITGVILSGTMGSFLTMVLLFILALTYSIYNRKKIFNKLFIKRFCILFSGLISIFLLVSIFINDRFSSDVSNLGVEVTNTIKGNVDESFGTGRIYIWREALKYFPKYKWTGIGIDNFAYLGFNDGTYIYDSAALDTVIYKAHNEFLQILVCEGLLTFIPYMLFLLVIFILAIKNLKYYENNGMYLSFLFVFFGYLFQAFFNIRILMIAPMFFVILGFLVNESVIKKDIKKKVKKIK